MNREAILRAHLRAFFWPPPGPLRRLATINAAVWGIVCLVALMQPESSGGVPILGAFFAGLSWGILRLCITEQDGRLAPRLPYRWPHAFGGRSLFGVQGLITVFVVLHDLTGWAAHPVLHVAGDALTLSAFALVSTWGIPAVIVATVSQARLGAGTTGQTRPQDQPPPNFQQQHGQWEYTSQDIPQDESWEEQRPPPPPPIHDAAWACGVMQVHPNATLEQIERVYKNLSSIWHPDTAQAHDEKAEKDAYMRRLNEAVSILRQAKKSAP